MLSHFQKTLCSVLALVADIFLICWFSQAASLSGSFFFITCRKEPLGGAVRCFTQYAESLHFGGKVSYLGRKGPPFTEMPLCR